MEPTPHITLSSSRPGRTLVIMAKAPRSGTVKTRLHGTLPASAVLTLYQCLLDDTIDLANSLTSVEVAIMCPESDQEELRQLFGQTVQIVAQQGQGLAAGLTSVFRHFAAAGGRHVIAFNSDSPHLSPSVLNTAFEMLAMHDVVIGPTHDGGYYLVGARAAHPSLFEGDSLGTRSALETLLMRIKALGLSTGFTEPFYDIDIADDLLRLARELEHSPAKALRTARWFVEWRHAIPQLAHAADGM